MGNPGQQDSNINLIFTSGDLIDKVKYEQLNDAWGSDHYFLVMEIDLQKAVYKKKTNKISSRKTNWKEYVAEMEGTEQGLLKEKYVELEIPDKYRYIVADMRRAVEFATYGKKRTSADEKKENNGSKIVTQTLVKGTTRI